MKIKAFTIIDLLLGMILSSIVISICIRTLQSVNSELRQNSKNQIKRMDESNVKCYFIYDAENADSLKPDNGNIMIFKNSELIRWVFQERSIIRNSDTLEVNADVVFLQNELNLIEEIKFEFLNGSSFKFKKKYYSLKLNSYNGD